MALSPAAAMREGRSGEDQLMLPLPPELAATDQTETAVGSSTLSWMVTGAVTMEKVPEPLGAREVMPGSARLVAWM